MLRLRVFGSLDLRDETGSPLTRVLAQPKRAAVLVFLTLAQPHGYRRRDELLALFWPDAGAQRARNALNQSLSFLRQHLPAQVLDSRGSQEVGVRPGTLTCDAIEFEQALSRGHHAAALDLYRGPFLHAFHLGGAGEFERWVDQQESHFRARAAESAWELANAQLLANELVEAERTAQRALAIMPANESAVLQFVEALHEAGDRAAALRFYAEFREQLQEDLGITPSEAVRDRVEELRDATPVRLVARTRPGSTPAHAQAAGPAVPADDTLADSRPGRTRRRWQWIVAVAFLGELSALIRTGFGESPGSTSYGSGAAWHTVAVLPLKGDGSDSSFVDGLHAELLTTLAGVPGLRVLSRNAVLPFRAAGTSARQIHEDLGADYVVEGDAAQSGGIVRIHIRLVDGTALTQLWAESYDREWTPGNLLQIQADVANRVATSIYGELSAETRVRPAEGVTEQRLAYEWFLRGATVPFAGYVEREIRWAIQCYEQAVAIDPSFAVAWARLSFAHAELYWFYEPTDDRATAARNALDRAVYLAPEHPEVRLAAAVYQYRIRRDYAQARREIEIARSQLPSDQRLYHLLGAINRRNGNWDEALDDWMQALSLDPFSATTAMEVGITHWLMRQYDEAAHYLERAVAIDPTLEPAVGVLLWVTLARTGQPVEALGELEGAARAGVVISENPFVQHARMMFELYGDRPARALEISQLDDRDLLEYQHFVMPLALVSAEALTALGNPDLAHTRFLEARRFLEDRLSAAPNDARLHAALGPTLARLGDKDGALRHAERAVQLLPRRVDAWHGAYFVEELAVTHALLGDDEAAIDIFTDLLSRPGPLSQAQLRLDPRLAQLRAQPRFSALTRPR